MLVMDATPTREDVRLAGRRNGLQPQESYKLSQQGQHYDFLGLARHNTLQLP